MCFPKRMIRRTLLAIVAILGCGMPGEGGKGVFSKGIWDAVENEDLDAIAAYVKDGGDLETGTSRGRTPLVHALKLKKKRSYELLLSLGASPNTICHGGAVVIQLAAAERDSFWLYEALKAGGDANLMNDVAVGNQKCRPLRFAIMIDSLENVKLLVDHGADIDEIDRHEVTPLTDAFRQSRYQIVLYLLESGANYNMHVHEALSLIWKMQRGKTVGHLDKKIRDAYAAVYKWFEQQGLDVRNASWDGKEWVFK